MLYRPGPHLRMWDTWMFCEGDDFHLFTLTQPYGKPSWDRVCHAVTSDWINWRECPDIILQGGGGEWDSSGVLTGSTFRTADGYGMTYGSRHMDREKIGLLFSRDLNTWTKYPGNPVLSPSGPYYEESPGEVSHNTVQWRDAYVIRENNTYEAFICAGDPEKPKTLNGCVARVTSTDLIDWEYHPPIASPGRYLDMEVPQYFRMNGFHYILFSTSGIYRHINLPSREIATGTFYLMAEDKYGDYRVPEDNMLIGSGQGRFDCYVGKVIETDEGLLLYHHICGYRTAFASPKTVRQNTDGTLCLERWKGMDNLKGEKQVDLSSSGQVLRASGKYPVGAWHRDGDILKGEAGPAMSAWIFDRLPGDFAAECTVDVSGAARAGVIFRIQDSDVRSERGWAVSIDRERSRIELCRPVLQCRTSLRLDPLDVIYGPVPEKCTIEIFMRDSYIEVYVSRCPCFILNASVVTASEHAKDGKFGIFVENGSAGFASLCVREIPGSEF